MVLLISFCACVGLVSGTILNLVSQARIWMSLARDGLVPARFAVVNSWTQTPVFATCVGGLMALALASFLEFEVLASMVSMGPRRHFVRTLKRIGRMSGRGDLVPRGAPPN